MSTDNPHFLASILGDVLSDIVATFVENEGSLDVARVLNYLDLYRYHVEHGAGGARPPESFESFVRDRAHLAAAAAGVSLESGIETATPSPLSPAANDPVVPSVPASTGELVRVS